MNMKKSKRENLKVDCNQNFLFAFSSFFFFGCGRVGFFAFKFPTRGHDCAACSYASTPV